MTDHRHTRGAARPIAAGPVLIGRERLTIGLRPCQDVMIIWGITSSSNDGATLGQRSLHVQFIIIAMEIVDSFRDDFALEILPRATSDAIAGIDCRGTIHGLGAEIGPPGLAPCPRRLCQT